MIRIFRKIFPIAVFLVSACNRAEVAEPQGFIVRNDTLCLDEYARPLSRIRMTHSVRHKDGYFCLFEKNGIYPGSYKHGWETFMLNISDDGEVEHQLPSPDQNLIHSDFFVRNDTLFWKNQFDEAHYWNTAAYEWTEIEELHDIVYEDDDWRVAVRYGGEFGSYTWYIDNHSEEQYIFCMLPERISRIDSSFYLTFNDAVLRLDDPRKGLLCDSSLKYENIGLCTKSRRNHPVTIALEMDRKGYRSDMMPDSLFISDTVSFITSFVIDTTLFSVINSHDRTFIARVAHEGLHKEYDFGEKFDFVDWSHDMDSRNNQQSSVLLKYMKGKSEMGLIDINGYSVRILHMCYAPDTLAFTGSDRFEELLNGIKSQWDSLSLQSVSEVESRQGSRKIPYHIGNGYLPDSIKNSCIQTHFVQQVDSSLVFQRDYFTSPENGKVQACFMDWYLNDVYKRISPQIQESIPAAVRRVMNCGPDKKEHTRRKSTEIWDNHHMTVELYFDSDKSLRLLLLRKD